MLCHWFSIFQRSKWPCCLQKVTNYLPNDWALHLEGWISKNTAVRTASLLLILYTACTEQPPSTKYCTQYFSKQACLSVLLTIRQYTTLPLSPKFTILQYTTMPLSPIHKTSVYQPATQSYSQYFSIPHCHSVLFTILQYTVLPLSPNYNTSVYHPATLAHSQYFSITPCHSVLITIHHYIMLQLRNIHNT